MPSKVVDRKLLNHPPDHFFETHGKDGDEMVKKEILGFIGEIQKDLGNAG